MNSYKKQQNLEENLRGIRHLLSHLHGEVSSLEGVYSQLLFALRKYEGAADFDDLTACLRRRAFFQKWQLLLSECQKLGESCGVIMVDIDHFKKINDNHGHSTGDEVIKGVAGLLKQFESPNCFVSRLGGEEFAIAMRGSEAQMLGVAEFIRRGAERMHGPIMDKDGSPSPKIEWKCTVSLGMASSRTHGYTPEKLLKGADEALYEAKRKGRNQVCAA